MRESKIAALESLVWLHRRLDGVLLSDRSGDHVKLNGAVRLSGRSERFIAYRLVFPIVAAETWRTVL